jgi:hypothetical protein
VILTLIGSKGFTILRTFLVWYDFLFSFYIFCLCFYLGRALIHPYASWGEFNIFVKSTWLTIFKTTKSFDQHFFLQKTVLWYTVLPNSHLFTWIHANSQYFTLFHMNSRKKFTLFHVSSREFSWIHKFSHFFTKSFFLLVWTAKKAKYSLSWAFSQKIFRTQNNPCYLLI